MSVEVWYGDKPRHEAEQKTMLELYQYLRPQPEHFVLLHNFFAGQSNEIDLVVLKRDGVFLAELKHVWDHIAGGREGDWRAIREDGTSTPTAPILSNRHSVTTTVGRTGARSTLTKSAPASCAPTQWTGQT